MHRNTIVYLIAIFKNTMYNYKQIYNKIKNTAIYVQCLGELYENQYYFQVFKTLIKY